MVPANDPLARPLFGVADRVAGMQAHVAQRIEGAVGSPGQQDRATGAIEPDVPASFGEARDMVDRDRGADEDPLTLGGEHLRAVKQLGVGKELGVAVEPSF